MAEQLKTGDPIRVLVGETYRDATIQRLSGTTVTVKIAAPNGPIYRIVQRSKIEATPEGPRLDRL